MTIRLMLTCALMSILLFNSEFAIAKTIRIDEARVRLSAEPGGKAAGAIHVENPSDEVMSVRVYAEDWTYSSDGSGDKSFYPAGTVERSSSNWLRFSPIEFDLTAYEQVAVNYTAHVPEDAGPGTHYTVLFFETTIGEATDASGAMVNVAGRVGSLIYVDIDGTVNREGRIDSLEVQIGQGHTPTTVHMTFSNTGNTNISLEGEFVVFDLASGQVVGRGETQSLYTREGMTVQGVTQWSKKLPSGTYDFVFTFRTDDDNIIVEERQVTIE